MSSDTARLVDPVEESRVVAESISRTARRSRRRVAVAESLTSGAIASQLGASPAASEWFLGGVVAYSIDVKSSVLGVDRGPVMTAACARQMAAGAARVTGADCAVAVTGVGGPDPEEDTPVGTVFIAVQAGEASRVEECHFTGDPTEIVHATTLRALQLLHTAIDS